MPPLPAELRSALETAILNAREVAERAAQAALLALAVDRERPFPTLNDDQRRQRNALRARARQLRDEQHPDGFQPLIEEVAYEGWHRMLFARFLAENNLLMHPSGVPVTLPECEELAPAEGEPNAWSLAARYASRMLPGIFRQDDPSAQVRFAPEGRNELERILLSLPRVFFVADDALGWVYQFWQSKKKDEVNASERKIGGADLYPVTQLFTEDYMVRFLLENSLGAWWAARHPDSSLIKEWKYLRWRDETDSSLPVLGEGLGARVPAAGTFPGWPERVVEVTVMDPCCGSGHFLIVAFDMLRKMRMEEEGLSAEEAADGAIRDNLFGLEIDLRCVQIAAFALVLANWKIAGYHKTPIPNIACSGIPVGGQLEDWLKLADGNQQLGSAMQRLYYLFRDAPTLGSLIDPVDVPLNERMFTADYSKAAPLLESVLEKERNTEDPVVMIFGASARAVARAAELASRQYTLVVTNVPYLTERKQEPKLKKFCGMHYPDSRHDLATVFLERCRNFAKAGGSYAIVTPQNWTFLISYKNLRRKLLASQSWNVVVRLGPKAFQASLWDFNVGLFIFTNAHFAEQLIAGLDVSTYSTPNEKAEKLLDTPITYVKQSSQQSNPDLRIIFEELQKGELLEEFAACYAGILNGDSPRFQKYFWEIIDRKNLWLFQQSTVSETESYGGREKLIYFDGEEGHLRESPEIRREKLHDSDQRGNKAWGKKGIAVSQMQDLPVTLYTGEKFDSNVAVIVPRNQDHIPALWQFCSSSQFRDAVRKIDQKLNVTNATFGKVPFDLSYWQSIADRCQPLPNPHSDEPTQWLFRGHPKGSTDPLQVAVARLVGYPWPQQEADGLDELADHDGVVCLPPVAGELPAEERLRALLAAACGSEWSPALQDRLLAEAGWAGRGLGEWLRDGFFDQHCRLFLNRPFIWHIWDGRKDGFSVLVNYHRLDDTLLGRLIYTYLGDWISKQREDHERGVAGAEGRLLAALELKKKLELIREGEPPYDIYVRWKPLHEQPVGWNPDLNDGVRLNIRPFVTAGVLRSRFNINWNKDRGKNPDGRERINDLHFSNAQKRAARQAAGVA